MNKPGNVQTRLGKIGLQNFAPYLMNRIMGRYNESLRAAMSEFDLTTTKMRALASLSVIDGILIRELAVYAVVESSTLSRALDKLEADGLIRRETDTADNRATRVFISDAGRKVFEQIWPAMAQSYEHLFRDIPDDERAAFVRTLQKILQNVRKHDF